MLCGGKRVYEKGAAKPATAGGNARKFTIIIVLYTLYQFISRVIMMLIPVPAAFCNTVSPMRTGAETLMFAISFMQSKS